MNASERDEVKVTRIAEAVGNAIKAGKKYREALAAAEAEANSGPLHLHAEGQSQTIRGEIEDVYERVDEAQDDLAALVEDLDNNRWEVAA